jgi:hypothetical protein
MRHPSKKIVVAIALYLVLTGLLVHLWMPSWVWDVGFLLSDAGVSVRMGEPTLLMTGPPDALAWGLYQNPDVWRLRDGRLVARVQSYADSAHNPIVHWRHWWFISQDAGRHWAPAHPSEAEEKVFLMEHTPALPDGRQVFFETRIADPREVLPAGAAPRRRTVRFLGATLPGVATEDLLPQYRFVRMFTRERGDAVWKEGRAYLPKGLLMPVIPVVDERRLGPDPDGLRLWRAYRELGFGRPGVPTRQQIQIGSLFPSADGQDDRVEVLKDGSWIFTANYVDENLPRPDGSAPELSARERPMAAILRSTDAGRTWSVWREISWRGPLIAHGHEYQSFRAYLAVMPQGPWVAMIRTRDPLNHAAGSSHALLFISRSVDEGRTWTNPEALRPYGIGPKRLVLDDGVVAVKFGRPGHFITFNADGKGEAWGDDVMLVPPANDFPLDTDNNNSFVATGPDRFIVIYSDFGYRDAEGRRRKAIFVREIVATRRRGIFQYLPSFLAPRGA